MFDDTLERRQLGCVHAESPVPHVLWVLGQVMTTALFGREDLGLESKFLFFGYLFL